MMRLSGLAGSSPCSTSRCLLDAVDLDLQAAVAPIGTARRASRRGGRGAPRSCAARVRAARPTSSGRVLRPSSSSMTVSGTTTSTPSNEVTQDGSAISTEVSSTTRVTDRPLSAHPPPSMPRPPGGDRSTPLLRLPGAGGELADGCCVSQARCVRCPTAPVVAQRAMRGSESSCIGIAPAVAAATARAWYACSVSLRRAVPTVRSAPSSPATPRPRSCAATTSPSPSSTARRCSRATCWSCRRPRRDAAGARRRRSVLRAGAAPPPPCPRPRRPGHVRRQQQRRQPERRPPPRARRAADEG